MRQISLILWMVLATVAQAEEFSGHFLLPGNTSPAFEQKVTSITHPDGVTEIATTISNDKKELVIKEEAKYKETTFISQTIQNFAEKKLFRASLHDGRVTFQTYELNGSIPGKMLSTHSERVGDNFVTGPLAENYIRAHWDDLSNGKKLSIRFAVFEREETIGFSFKKKEDVMVDGKQAMTLIMRPTSMFVSMVVKPMEISVDKETRQIIHYKGRTSLKKDEKPILEADIVYDRSKSGADAAPSRNTASEHP